MGKHDLPSAGKTPEGKRGQKPQRYQVKVQTPSGTWLRKGMKGLFGSPKKGGKS